MADQTARATDASMVPDFTGRWEEYVKTPYDGYIPDEALHESNNPEADMQRVAATLQINQTWRTIIIHLKTDNSEPVSTGAIVLTEDGRWPSLNYQKYQRANTLGDRETEWVLGTDSG